MIEAPAIVPHAGTTEPRAAVTWAGPGQPIVLKVYGPDGEVAVPLTPVRALELARDLTEPAVTVIKADWPG